MLKPAFPPPALDGERLEFQSDAGRLSVYVNDTRVNGTLVTSVKDGSKDTGPLGNLTAPPLLLIHSVNAAASAAEVRPLYNHYGRLRRVYALDLPGYGFSDRSDRTYTIRLMSTAIESAVAFIHDRDGEGPIDALALSLSCEFLARAAVEKPAFFRSLALVSPTGFSGTRPRRDAPGSSLAKPWVYKLLRGPGWDEALFRALTRRRAIRYFLKRTWGSQNIDQTLLDYDVLTANQPGARYAPLFFLSGGLFSADIHDVYEKVAVPVWMSHGVRGDFTDYRNVGLVQGRPNWNISVFPTGALPHFEQFSSFRSQYDSFLQRNEFR